MTLPGLFDDLDNFDAAPLAPATPPTEPFARGFVNVAAGMEPCRRCRGTGSYGSYGTCYTCKGSGKVKARATTPEQAYDARVKRARTKAAAEKDSEEAFARMHPAAWAWITRKADTFQFAASMLDALRKWGSLTGPQHAAIDKCIAKDAARTYDRNIRAETAAIMDMSRIVEAFDAVKANGAKKASLRLHGLTLSMAPAGGKNPGAIYAKRGGTYLGKIDESGTYRPSYDSTPADLELLRAANIDPRAAAIRYARETGECSCCGRELTDPESIALGIGPICAAKWGI